MADTIDAPPRRYHFVDDRIATGRTPIGPRLVIWLDGRPVTRVRGYDQDLGTVTRIRTDAFDQPVVNRLLGVVEEETLHGRVDVAWRVWRR
jgi:hypothetical protein